MLIDGARGEEPWAVLTGDSLFVGDIARPDLAVEKAEGARGIFSSLRALLELCDDVEVWPGHLGGSLCGGPAMDLKVSTTIGYERRHNALLGVGDEGEFVERATAGLRPQPPNFKSIVSINRGPLERRPVDAEPLTPRQVELSNAPVIDIRTALQFDEAHIPGAISNTVLQSGFGTRLAWIAGPDTPVVLVGRDDDDALHAVELAAAVGVGQIAGYLAGGMTSWREERLPTAVDRAPDDPRAARARRRAADPRRARARRVGGRPHPGLGLRALPRHPRAPGRSSTPPGRSPSSAPPASAPRSAPA